MRRNFLSLTFITISLLGILHQLGNTYFLYWTWTWFDILMHFLGGLSIGLLFIWANYLSTFRRSEFAFDRHLVLKTFLFVMFVGLAWEFFEYYFDIANPTWRNYKWDTSMDLFFDAVGALVAGFSTKLLK